MGLTVIIFAIGSFVMARIAVIGHAGMEPVRGVFFMVKGQHQSRVIARE